MQIKKSKRFIKKLPINKPGEDHVTFEYNKNSEIVSIRHVNKNNKLHCTYMPAFVTFFVKEDETFFNVQNIASKIFEAAYYLNGEKSPNKDSIYKIRYNYDGSIDVKYGVSKDETFEIRERKHYKQAMYYSNLSRLKKVVYYNDNNEIHRENGAAVTIFNGDGGITEEYCLNNDLICCHNSYYFRNKKLIKNETINFERLDDLLDAKAIYNLAKHFNCSKQFIDKIESSLVLLELGK